MPRILVLNNYPLDQAWDEVRRKEKPDHHLYGINYFQERGYKIEIAPFAQANNKISWHNIAYRLPIPLGDLDQESWALSMLNSADLIYAPCQTQTGLLAYMQALGMIKIPIVCLAHHRLLPGRLALIKEPAYKLMLSGIAAFPSLSTNVATGINKIAGGHRLSLPLSFGPDKDFYLSNSPVGTGIIAAGRTGRDFVTFGKAASLTNVESKIICLDADVKPEFSQFAANVSVQVEAHNNYMKYPPLMQLYAQARALAIPLFGGEFLSGLTSLMDALGMGKPVIITRHPLIDLDVEREGIGIAVAPDDIQGWKNAIEYLENNPDEALAMGQRARRLVDNGRDSQSFAQQMMDIFATVLHQ